MKKALILLLSSLLVFGCKTGSVKIKTSDGTLTVTPMTDNSVRVQMKGKPTHAVEELLFTEKVAAPAFEKTEDNDAITIKLAKMTVVFNKADETLSYYDKDGGILFAEIPGTRVLKETTVGGTPVVETSTDAAHTAIPQPDPIPGDPTYIASQSFMMQPGDHQFGTGQFQDGYLDIMGLTRRLTQNNTQIVSPVIISSKGYGILWHNYGRTDFNPSQNMVALNALPAARPAAPPVPGMRMMAPPKVFEGEFSVDKAGKYSVHLDVGSSARGGHTITIDGQQVYQDSNNWIPTVSAFVELAPGKHTVQAQGSTDDKVDFYWREVDNTTTFCSPVAQDLDYAVFAGTPDEVVATFRTLTGPVPAMPDYAFGFVQCRERYDTQAELLENAHGFVDRNIPVSMIVQDWQWWGKTGWNSMVFDKDKYPDPKAMVDEVHDLGIKIMISVWSRVETGSKLGDDLRDKGYFIPGTEWVDYFNPEAAQYYWECFRDSLVKLGFDAWWFDATEPDNDYILQNRRLANNTIPGDVYRNVYPLVMNKTMYEGFKTYYTPDDMPVVLTRSAFAGSQRYGVFVWSGDVGHDWTTLRRQLIGGLGYVSTGLPWWTYDAGGFSRPRDQYTSADYQERMLRWIQASVFLPMMRVHGSGSHTEPWNYSDETYRIYVNCINTRYKLLPYITENAKKVSEEGYTLMRPLVFDFYNDEEALKQDCEYMFGPDYLVCPVTEPGVTSWKVYLPENANGWEDFRDGTRYAGGQYIDAPVDIEFIPVFKKL